MKDTAKCQAASGQAPHGALMHCIIMKALPSRGVMFNKGIRQFHPHIPGGGWGLRHSCRQRAVQVSALVKARWCIDIKYGFKQEALALLQEWVQGVGSSAGLQMDKTSLNSGALGAPESRLELELEFGSLAAYEDFLEALPRRAHKAWSERAQKYIVDGSPCWQVFRAYPLGASLEGPSAAETLLKAWQSQTNAASSGGTAGLEVRPCDWKRSMNKAHETVFSGFIRVQRSQVDPEQGDSWELEAKAIGQAAQGEHLSQGADTPRVVLDWKGDPMTINPGDRLPM